MLILPPVLCSSPALLNLKWTTSHPRYSCSMVDGVLVYSPILLRRSRNQSFHFLASRLNAVVNIPENTRESA